MRKFDKFHSHGAVACFNCCKRLGGEHTESDYPAGRGRFQKFCGDCRMYTWYDLTEALPDGLRGQALADAIRDRL